VIDEDFIKVLAGVWNQQAAVDFTTLLDVMSHEPALLPQYQSVHRRHRASVKGLFDRARSDFRRVPGVRERLLAARYASQPGRATAYLYSELTRTCIVTNDTFAESDAFGFQHTIVSVAYCDFVLLDRKWTRRCRVLPLARVGAAQV